jgi:signal transduction histidine kinase
MNKDNSIDLLNMLSAAAAIVKDGTVIASNIKVGFDSEIDSVFVPTSDSEADIAGVRFRYSAPLNGGAELYVAESDLPGDQYTHLLNNINFVLREELSVTQAAVQLIQKKLENGDAEDALRHLKMIQKSQFRLARLGENIKEISGSDDDRLIKVTVDFRELCRNLAGSISALLGENLITFFDRTDPEDDTFTEADPAKLEIMLLNLISNAIKYTHGDNREVKLMLYKCREHFLISVINFAEAHWDSETDTMFKTYMTDSSTRDGGVGFGLMAAMHIARLHDGSIISSANHGQMTVTVSIPQTPVKLTFRDKEDLQGDDSMRRLLVGLSDVIHWEKYGAPYIG